MKRVYKVVGEHPGKAKMGCGCRNCKDAEYFIVPHGLDDLISMCKDCVKLGENTEVYIVPVEKIRDWKPGAKDIEFKDDVRVSESTQMRMTNE